MSLTRIQV